MMGNYDWSGVGLTHGPSYGEGKHWTENEKIMEELRMKKHPTDEAKKRALADLSKCFLTIIEPSPESFVVPTPLTYEAISALEKHWPTIEAALTDAVVIDAPEGLDEAIAKCDRYENSPDTLLLSREERQILLKAARLYAQGRTQSALDKQEIQSANILKAMMEKIGHGQSLVITRVYEYWRTQFGDNGKHTVKERYNLLEAISDQLDERETPDAAPPVTGGADAVPVWHGFKIIPDVKIPNDEIRVVDAAGKLVGLIKLAAPPSSAEKEGV